MKRNRYIIVSLILFLGMHTGFSQERYTSLHYSMGVPVGETKDFIEKSSFRGLGLEFGQFVREDLSLGIVIGWNVFYEALPKATYPLNLNGVDGVGEIRGQQYRYMNSMPLLVTARYHLRNSGTVLPFVGLGTGTYYNKQRTTMGVYAANADSWHFGLLPQLGVNVPVSLATELHVSAGYNYAFKTSKLDAQSWISINVGFLFNY